MIEIPPLPPEVWLIGSIDDEPCTRLVEWRVFHCQVPGLDGATTHLVGYCPRNREGRVSSPIDTFDPTRRLVETQSGRVYELVGRPGSCPDADHTWGCWRRINDATVVADVTSQHFAQIQQHNAQPGQEAQK